MGVWTSVWGFLSKRKKYWLVPMLSVMVIFLILLAIGQKSAGVFVYNLF
jgi:hypothetical protein